MHAVLTTLLIVLLVGTAIGLFLQQRLYARLRRHHPSALETLAENSAGIMAFQRYLWRRHHLGLGDALFNQRADRVRRYWKAWFLFFFLGVLALLWSTVASRPVSAALPSLRFLGFTNAFSTYHSSTQRFGLFLITNTTPRHLAWVPVSIECKSGANWVSNEVVGNYPTAWEVRPVLAGRYSAACYYYVPPPGASRWRLRVRCSELTHGSMGAFYRGKDLIVNLINRLKGRALTSTTYAGESYDILSQEVAQ